MARKPTKKRRLWTTETKRRIVDEANVPGVKKRDVAAKHNITESLLYKWERDLGVSATATKPPPRRAASLSTQVRQLQEHLANLDREISRLEKERKKVKAAIKALS